MARPLASAKRRTHCRRSCRPPQRTCGSSTNEPGTSVPSPKSLGLRCVQNGPPARREEGAYLKRYVTDEQRSRRPIFNATPWAATSWLFFRVARSTRIDSDMGALAAVLLAWAVGVDLRNNPRTEDAQVRANVIGVAPQVGG